MKREVRGERKGERLRKRDTYRKKDREKKKKETKTNGEEREGCLYCRWIEREKERIVMK